MDIEQAKLDPASAFASPAAVCENTDLTEAQKIEVLRRWEYDARELQVAADENMGPGPGSMLDYVLAALRKLGADTDTTNSSPTKQGGV